METQYTKEEAFAIIKAARERLRLMQPPHDNASEKTRSGYLRELRRLLAKGGHCVDQFWAATCETPSKRTYYRRLAAIKTGLPLLLGELLRTQDAAQRASDDVRWRQAVAALDVFMSLSEGVAKKISESEGSCPIESPRPRHSKRQTLRGLPDDWREQIATAMVSSKYMVDYLVAAVTGCRPHELELGIEVRLDDHCITLTIFGAKVKEKQGQPERTIKYSVNSTNFLVQTLIDQMRSQKAHFAIVQIESKDNFTSSLRRIGKKLWPRRRAEITPYCLRHAAASDFKNYLSPEEVSAALGHTVDATASVYGQRQMAAGGGLKPTEVHAVRTVKPTRRGIVACPVAP